MILLTVTLWTFLHASLVFSEGPCLYQEGIPKFNLDDSLCRGQGCECYVRTFKEKIDFFQEDQRKKVATSIINLHKELSSRLIEELIEVDLLYEQNGKSLLNENSSMGPACSFDSLKTHLSCRSEMSSQIVLNLKKEFDQKVGQRKDKKETPLQCLSEGERKGVLLIKKRKAALSKLMPLLSRIPKKSLKRMTESQNPMEYLSQQLDRNEEKVFFILKDLPIVKNIFQSQEGASLFVKMMKEGAVTSQNVHSFLTNSPELYRVIDQNLTGKCQQIFQSIDKIACQKIAHPFVSNDDFNRYYLNYDKELPEGKIEAHLFVCQAEQCHKKKSCQKETQKGLDPDQLISFVLGKESIEDLKNSTYKENHDINVNKSICSFLLCGDKSHGLSLFYDVQDDEDSEDSQCSPLLNPKRTPMEAYALLGCPDAEVCQTEEFDYFKSYLTYYQQSTEIVDAEVLADDVRLKDGKGGVISFHSKNPGKKPIRKKKKSLFIKNFLGDVGKDPKEFLRKPAQLKLANGNAKKDSLLREKKKEKLEGDKTVPVEGKRQKLLAPVFNKKANNRFYVPVTQKRVVSKGPKGSSLGSDYNGKKINSLSNELGQLNSLNQDLQKGLQEGLKEALEREKSRNDLSSAKAVASSFSGLPGQSDGRASQKDYEESKKSKDDYRQKGAGHTVKNMGAPEDVAWNRDQNIPEERSTGVENFFDESGKEKSVLGSSGRGGPGEKSRSVSSDGLSSGGGLSLGSIPNFDISKSELAKLDESFVKGLDIKVDDSFIIKVAVGKGKKKKLIPVMVERIHYKGKFILRPIKERHNVKVFDDVLASPLFLNYRQVLSVREQRKTFFDILSKLGKFKK